MKEKTIYDNESSKITARFDGEIIELNQVIYGISESDISLYQDEFEEIVKFISENNTIK